MTIDLVNREPWTANAKCLGDDISAYETQNLPHGAPRTTVARRLCTGCPVLNQCGQYALNHPDTIGVVMAGIAYPDDVSHPKRIQQARKAVAKTIGAPPPPHLQKAPRTDTPAAGGGLINANKTHCKHGHEYTPENTRETRNHKGQTSRRCRTCLTNEDRERKQRARRNTAAWHSPKPAPNGESSHPA